MKSQNLGANFLTLCLAALGVSRTLAMIGLLQFVVWLGHCFLENSYTIVSNARHIRALMVFARATSVAGRSRGAKISGATVLEKAGI